MKIIAKSRKGAANEYGAFYAKRRGTKPPKTLSVSKGRKLYKSYKLYTVKKK